MPAEITVVCPQCGNKMRSSAEHVGRQGRCPSCRSLVLIQSEGGDDSLLSLHPDESRLVEIRQRTDTDVPAFTAGLIGLAISVAFYLVVFFPFRKYAIGELFVDRGVIPYVATLMTCWGLAILFLKYRAVKIQLSYADQELELIPLEIGLQITATNVSQFLDHLGAMPVLQRNSILGRRIQGALEHFKARNNVPEVQQYLGTQAEIDASQVDAGYTLLRAFIWAIPILGFIGTVMGIGSAVTGLNATLGNEAGGDGLMSSMQLVTAGLATAFDTTLLALSMAIVLLFPTESLRTTEYRMLDQIASFANESLLRRLSDDYQKPGPDELPEIVRDSLDSAFREHQRWLAQWQSQVSRLGQSIGGDFEQSVRNIQRELADAEAERLRKMHELSQSLSSILEKVGETSDNNISTHERLSQHLQKFGELADELEGRLSPIFDNLRSAQQTDQSWIKAQLGDTIIGPNSNLDNEDSNRT